MRGKGNFIIIDHILENSYFAKGVFILTITDLQNIINWYNESNSGDSKLSNSDTNDESDEKL